MANHAHGAPALVFQNTHFSVVDRNGHSWLRSSEIASALGYADASAISRIYARNSDEFTDAMTCTVKLTDGVQERDMRIFSLRGAHLAAMFARTVAAKQFRRWLLDLLDREVARCDQADSFDWRAEVSAAGIAPTVIPGPELQAAIKRRAWALTLDAYDILRTHISRRVAAACEFDVPRKINHARALDVIASVTLDSALAPRHLERLNQVLIMSDNLIAIAQHCGDGLREIVEGR